ncbi:unnamed protein product [Mytilus coruscus]|uniref:Uncharacterized protein n=1 Tax=Mytilus coruscus TaxID=42192 RepID=A0A6J8F548_MYTCO|nr:unnamed protein product [Mytilus coruscus]
MDKNNQRSVSFINYKRGLQTRISTVSSKNRSKNNSVPANDLEILHLEVKELMEKSAVEYVPQADILNGFYNSSEKNRGLETRNKSKAPQQVSQKTTLQNGLSINSFECSKTRGLGNISRSKGRIYAYPCISKTQTVSEVLCKKQPLLTIFSSTIWSFQVLQIVSRHQTGISGTWTTGF